MKKRNKAKKFTLSPEDLIFTIPPGEYYIWNGNSRIQRIAAFSTQFIMDKDINPGISPPTSFLYELIPGQNYGTLKVPGTNRYFRYTTRILIPNYEPEISLLQAKQYCDENKICSGFRRKWVRTLETDPNSKAFTNFINEPTGDTPEPPTKDDPWSTYFKASGNMYSFKPMVWTSAKQTLPYFPPFPPDIKTVLMTTTDITPGQEDFYYFVLSTDGRLYLPKLDICVIPGNGLIVNNNCVKGIWQFTKFPPSFKQSNNVIPTLWDNSLKGKTKTNDSYANVFNNLAGNEGKPSGCNYSDGFNGRCYCTDCSLSHPNCPNGTIEVGRNSSACGTKAYCIKGVQNYDPGNKELCCGGNPSIMIDGKLNFDKCALVPTQFNICGDSFNNSKGEYTKSEVWAPWSSDCDKQPVIKDFCGQHNTMTDSSMLISNSSCATWCISNPTECSEVKNKYCSLFPSSKSCVQWCTEGSTGMDSKLCRTALENFCVGNNLESKSCKDFCLATNCDTEIAKYCANLGNNALKNDYCGCFMSTQFYENFFNSAKTKGIDLGYPSIPQCYYPKCSASRYQTAESRRNPPRCPDVQSCIQITNIEAGGNISGDIIINNDNKCNFAQRTQDCKKPDEYLNKDKKCIPCPTGTKPSQDKLSCFNLNLESDLKKYSKSNEFSNYINNIGSNLDKNKINTQLDNMTNAILKNSNCNTSLEKAKDCLDTIPYLCSIKGLTKYCEEIDDEKLCVSRKPKFPDGAQVVNNFNCTVIRNNIKPVDEIKEALADYVGSGEFNSLIRSKNNIDYDKFLDQGTQIVKNIMAEDDCIIDKNSAIECMNDIISHCNDNETGSKYSVSCKSIRKEEENGNNKSVFIAVGIIFALIILGVIFKKKK